MTFILPNSTNNGTSHQHLGCRITKTRKTTIYIGIHKRKLGCDKKPLSLKYPRASTDTWLLSSCRDLGSQKHSVGKSIPSGTVKFCRDCQKAGHRRPYALGRRHWRWSPGPLGRLGGRRRGREGFWGVACCLVYFQNIERPCPQSARYPTKMLTDYLHRCMGRRTCLVQ